MFFVGLENEQGHEFVKDLEKLCKREGTPHFILPVINDQDERRLYFLRDDSLGVAMDLRSLLTIHGRLLTIPDGRQLDQFGRMIAKQGRSQMVQGVECVIVGDLVLLSRESSVKHCYEFFDYRIIVSKLNLGVKEVDFAVFNDA